MIISSQRHIDDEIVKTKQANNDYYVSVFCVGEIDGVEYSVVVDGNHSLEAARRDGVTPCIVDVDGDIAREYQAEINKYGAIAWLESHWIDSDYYDVETGLTVF